MNLEPVDSSLIKAIGYDTPTLVLSVEFHNGKVTNYADVSPDTHAALIGADSIGRYFLQNIKGKYTPSTPE